MHKNIYLLVQTLWNVICYFKQLLNALLCIQIMMYEPDSLEMHWML